VPTPSGSKESPHAAVAAHWRRRPAARGPANQFSACREELDRFESRTCRWQLACHPQPPPTSASTQRCRAMHAKHRVKTDAVRAHARSTVPSDGLWLTTATCAAASPGQCQPEAMAGHDVTAIEVGEHEGGRIGVRHDHPGNQGRGDRQEQRARQGTAAQLISASCPLTRSSGTRALRSPVSPTPVQGPRAAAWPACGRTP
jgi:hypothetical protein